MLLNRLYTVFRLALLIIKESNFRMNRGKYRDKARVTSWQLLVSAVMRVVIVNILGLIFSLTLLIPLIFGEYGEMDIFIRLASIGSLSALISLFAVFSDSWIISNYSIVEPLTPLPLRPSDISSAFLIASSLGVLWSLIVAPISMYIVYVVTGDILISILSPIHILLGIFFGMTLGLIVSSILSGRRYAGTSKKTIFLQILNIVLYGLVSFALYQLYSLSNFILLSIKDISNYIVGDPSFTILQYIYPFQIILFRDFRLLGFMVTSIWFLIVLILFKSSANIFISKVVFPTFKYVDTTKRRVSKVVLSSSLLYALLIKDLKMILRDIRLAPIIVLPPIMLISMLVSIGLSSFSNPLVAISIILFIGILSPFISVEAINIDSRSLWSLYSAGVKTLDIAISKAILSTFIALTTVLPIPPMLYIVSHNLSILFGSLTSSIIMLITIYTIAFMISFRILKRSSQEVIDTTLSIKEMIGFLILAAILSNSYILLYLAYIGYLREYRDLGYITSLLLISLMISYNLIMLRRSVN